MFEMAHVGAIRFLIVLSLLGIARPASAACSKDPPSLPEGVDDYPIVDGSGIDLERTWTQMAAKGESEDGLSPADMFDEDPPFLHVGFSWDDAPAGATTSRVTVGFDLDKGYRHYFGRYTDHDGVSCIDTVGVWGHYQWNSHLYYAVQVVHDDPAKNNPRDIQTGEVTTSSFTITFPEVPQDAYLIAYVITPVILAPGESAPAASNKYFLDQGDLYLVRKESPRVRLRYGDMAQARGVARATRHSKTARLTAAAATTKPERDPGAVVVQHGKVAADGGDNKAPRKKIVIEKIQPDSYDGKVELRWPGDKIAVWDAETDGTKLKQDHKANRFDPADLPKELWLEGLHFSDAMRDIEISADLVVRGKKTRADYSKATVVWIEQPSIRFSGELSRDNAARDLYAERYGTTQLGVQLIFPPDGLAVGFGYEAFAAVHPPDFKFPGAILMLDRDIQTRAYAPLPITEPGLIDEYSTVIPPGNDGSPATNDANPEPDGRIYDFDLPYLGLKPLLQGTGATAAIGAVFSDRFNAKEYASVTLEEWPPANPGRPADDWKRKKWVRCSPVQKFFVRHSAIKVAPDGPKGERHWEILKPPNPKAAPNDNQGCLGQTALSKKPSSFKACK